MNILNTKIPVLLGKKKGFYEIDGDYITLINNLNIGISNLADGKSRIAYRTDFIGFEIDRFFRVTEGCKPGLLTIGQNLLNHLDYKIEKIKNKLDIYKLIFKYPLGTHGTSYKRYNYFSEKLCSKQMKGIRTAYKICHIFRVHSLNPNIFHPDSYVEDFFKDT